MFWPANQVENTDPSQLQDYLTEIGVKSSISLQVCVPNYGAVHVSTAHTEPQASANHIKAET